MNDLNGLDWSKLPAAGHQPGKGNYSSFSTLQPAPQQLSGRTSPAVTSRPATKTTTNNRGDDSFSNLVAFSGSNTNRNLSLQEQQRQREASKLQQLVGQKQKLQEQWAGNDDVWNNLGSGRSTPGPVVQSDVPKPTQSEDDDLFAAFNQPPVNQDSSKAKPSSQFQRNLDPEDDDPFDLAGAQARSKKSVPLSQTVTAKDDDDILGDLSRPVQERSRAQKKVAPVRQPSPEPELNLRSHHPQDRAVAELVDMGFPAEKARRALEATNTGLNVQAAVGLLLNQAHEEARQKSRGREPTSQDDPHGPPLDQIRRPVRQERTEDRSSTPSGDPTKTAQEIGTAFMKSAGAFWKSAQKQVQQAVNEFNSDSESGASTPKWMREPTAPPRSRPQAREQPSSATDEAMMLETERPTPPPRSQPRSRVAEQIFDASANSSRDHSPAMPSRLKDTQINQSTSVRQQDPLTSMMRSKPQQIPKSAREILSKQNAEDQASQAYTSSNRRRKPPPSAAALDNDLLEGAMKSSQPLQVPSSRQATRSAPPTKPVASIAARPPPPTRSIPQISAIALKASHTARRQGNAHYKRGDYSAAHEAYSSSLRHVPTTHPLQIVLLTNRALTALKTGQPKLALIDADTAITLIGISKGESETIDVQDDDGKTSAKPMRDYYGKSLMRKAEALENLEKWSEAAAVWRLCVEDGHGGATAIQGRARAEKASAPKPSAPVVARKPPARVATRSAPPSTKPAAAVSALRAQNQAADKLDDEKFALADVVSARLNSWKGGKEDNLRALLASLDTVLWEGAGWKKIGMADLVLPNKVKINYMKGIGKCHPDKVSPSSHILAVETKREH